MQAKSRRLILYFLMLGSFFVVNSGFYAKRYATKLFNSAKINSILVSTKYGNFDVSEPVIIELLDHPMFKRLKNVRQYGISHQVVRPENYDRYEHSVGVFALLKKYDASLKEQVAGLLHDASHTAFSHVGEWIFDHQDGKSSYQDDNHDQFLIDSGLADILLKHNLTVEDINHKNNDFRRLEQDLPDLCMDRIEYNLQGGLREGLIDYDDLQEILESLNYQDGKWFFDNSQIAKKFSIISLYHTKNIWGNPVSLAVYKLTGDILKKMLNQNLITLEDIRFGEDDDIWQKMNSVENEDISGLVEKLKNNKNIYKPEKQNPTLELHSKFRGVDPWVKTENSELKRLTEIDEDYNNQYQELKDEYSTPLGVKEVC